MLREPGADMSTTEATSSTTVNRTGFYLAVLQLVFTLGWTTYVIYLPKLCAEVGIPPTAVILILMLDQAIFTITDTAMGIAADKIAPFVGKLGVFVGTLTAISCAAFVALPFVAGTGPGAQVWFIGLILIWVVTSSALRAPPLTLLGKYGARPAIPFLSALAMLGYGLAGAVSPYLGVVLRNHDPRLPFVISGVVLLLTTLALSKVERNLAQAPPVAKASVPAKSLGQVPMFFIASMVILSLGYQLHFSINSTPFFLRFAKPEELQWLMPVFWIGFNIAMFPASVVVKHRGGLIVMGAAGVLGALAVLAAEMAGNLNMLIAAQFIAGAAWGCMLMAAVSAALAIGETGAEGKVVGLVFSALALATFARMAAVAGGLQKLPEYAPLLHWAPVACWSVAGAGLLVIAASRMQRSVAA
jgi:MFS family permease